MAVKGRTEHCCQMERKRQGEAGRKKKVVGGRRSEMAEKEAGKYRSSTGRKRRDEGEEAEE